jgi:hypothetical protein
LVILSDKTWTLYNAISGSYIYTLKEKALNAEAEGENTIWLIVDGQNAYLFINGVYSKSLDVRAKLTAGDVSPATGLYYGNVDKEGVTKFYDFTVWSLP